MNTDFIITDDLVKLYEHNRVLIGYVNIHDYVHNSIINVINTKAFNNLYFNKNTGFLFRSHSELMSLISLQTYLTKESYLIKIYDLSIQTRFIKYKNKNFVCLILKSNNGKDKILFRITNNTIKFIKYLSTDYIQQFYQKLNKVKHINGKYLTSTIPSRIHKSIIYKNHTIIILYDFCYSDGCTHLYLTDKYGNIITGTAAPEYKDIEHIIVNFDDNFKKLFLQNTYNSIKNGSYLIKKQHGYLCVNSHDIQYKKYNELNKLDEISFYI